MLTVRRKSFREMLVWGMHHALMVENLTIGALYRAKVLTAEDVEAAVDAFLVDPTTTTFMIGRGYQIDLAEAVRAHEWASVTIGTKDATEHLKRTAVRTAVMLARPEKGG